MRRGVSSEKMRKLRTNAGDKDTSNAPEVKLATIHNTKYYIPLDHPILNNHGDSILGLYLIPLCFEITFAPVANIVVYSDQTKPPRYKVANLEFEYQ